MQSQYEERIIEIAKTRENHREREEMEERREEKSDILVIAGTTEAREVIQALIKKGYSVTAAVATEYGGEVLKGTEAEVLEGRKNAPKFVKILERIRPSYIIDASHPFAVLVTEEIKKAAKAVGIPCIRYLRREEEFVYEKVIKFSQATEAAEFLRKKKGNFLLTTGANTISVYRDCIEDFDQRGYVRVLNQPESEKSCRKSGIPFSHVIFENPPFSKEDNLKLLDRYEIRFLVSKDSGRAGGLLEKMEAARERNIPLLLVERPKQEEGIENLDELFRLLDFKGGENE